MIEADFIVGIVIGILLCPVTDIIPSPLTLREVVAPVMGPTQCARNEKAGRFAILEEGWEADSKISDEDDEDDHVQHGLA